MSVSLYKTSRRNQSNSAPKSLYETFLFDEWSFWGIYFCLVSLRIYICFRNGGLFTFEFIEEFSIVLDDMLGMSVSTYYGSSCNLKLLPYLAAMPPVSLYHLLKYLGWLEETTAFMLLSFCFRITFFCYSLVLDAIMFHLAGGYARYGRSLLFLWSISWVNLIYFTQPLKEIIFSIIVGGLLLLEIWAYWTPRGKNESHYEFSIRTSIYCFLHAGLFGTGVSSSTEFIYIGLPLASLALWKSFQSRKITSGNFENIYPWLLTEVIPWITIASLAWALCQYFESQFGCSSVRGQLISSSSLIKLLQNIVLLVIPAPLVFQLFFYRCGNLNALNYTDKKDSLVISFVAVGLTGLLFSGNQSISLLPFAVPVTYLAQPALKNSWKLLGAIILAFQFFLGLFIAIFYQDGVSAFYRLESNLGSFYSCVSMPESAALPAYVFCRTGKKKNGTFYVSPCDRFETNIITYNTVQPPPNFFLLLNSSRSIQRNHLITVKSLGNSTSRLLTELDSLNIPRIPQKVSSDYIYWKINEEKLSGRITCSRTMLVLNAPHCTPWLTALPRHSLKSSIFSEPNSTHFSWLGCSAKVPVSTCLTCHFDTVGINLLPYIEHYPYRFVSSLPVEMQETLGKLNSIMLVNQVIYQS